MTRFLKLVCAGLVAASAFAGCASTRPDAVSSGLRVCLGPVLERDGRRVEEIELDGWDLQRARYIQSPSNAPGCELIVTIRDGEPKGWDWSTIHTEAVSGFSGQTLWT